VRYHFERGFLFIAAIVLVFGSHKLISVYAVLPHPALLSSWSLAIPELSGKDRTDTEDRLPQVAFIDVGQGDSIFIKTPAGCTALIDGGYANGNALAYLQKQRVSRLDLIIVSHPHADHIGGLVQMLNALPVKAIWTSGASHTTSVFENLLDTIAAKKVPYYEASIGQSIQCQDLSFVVLFDQKSAANLNNTSLVLRLQYQAQSFLFTGDAEQPVERQLIQSASTMLASTILKVGHHGSATSSTSAFLTLVHPKIAVYSASASNSYGHPHRSTIANLEAVGATIYGTDIHGTVTILTDGSTFTIQTEKSVPPLFKGATIVPASTFLPITSMTPVPQSTLRYDPKGPDRDCKDFATQAEAQAFFIAAGGPTGDRHRLDGDNDGIACESLR